MGRVWSQNQRLAHTDGAGCSWSQAGCLGETAASEAGPADSLLQKQTNSTAINQTAAVFPHMDIKMEVTK